MAQAYEQQKAERRARAKEVLALVESGDAIRLKHFWLRFASGTGQVLLFKPEAFKRLCNLLGSEIKGAVEFADWTIVERHSPSSIWLRADMLCSIKEYQHIYFFLIDGTVEFVDRGDLPDCAQGEG